LKKTIAVKATKCVVNVEGQVTRGAEQGCVGSTPSLQKLLGGKCVTRLSLRHGREPEQRQKYR
ncbi:MAG: hypothetical protein JWP57_2357, partial [Spirosoma sp.]|nr:hypothetical protein [Spirosoma sp.]